MPFSNVRISLENEKRFGLRTYHAQHAVEKCVELLSLCALTRLSDSFLEFIKADFLNCNRWDNLYAEEMGQTVDVDLDPMFLYLIHEIKHDDDLLPHVNELLREEEVPLKMRRVDDIDDDVGFKDDVVVRVVGRDGGTRVDVRSVSRVGLSDLGTNARRVRDFLRRLTAGLAAAPG